MPDDAAERVGALRGLDALDGVPRKIGGDFLALDW